MRRGELSVNLVSILCAVDFSEQSGQALRWAGAFAERFHSRLTIVSVVDPLLAEAARIRFGQDLAKSEAEPALREFVASTWPDGASGSVQTVFQTLVGEPSAAILETAAAGGADLIVVGTQGLGGFRKWLLGSTTERLVRQTHVPILAVPPATELENASPGKSLVCHIVAATDFSDSSVAAAKMAARLAAEFSASLTLAHVVEPLAAPPQWQPLAEESDQMRIRTARAKLKDLADEIRCPQPCDEMVALGQPEELIGSVAGDRRAQIIVMGLASDQGAFAPRPGWIAYRVLCSTTIPVLVVPPPRV